MTPSGVPASNALAVWAALSKVAKLLSYAEAESYFVVARVPRVSSLMKRLGDLQTARSEFETKITSYKRADDLCEAWAMGDGKIEAQFMAWLPLAREAFDIILDMKTVFISLASREQLDALDSRLHAAAARLVAEEEAANAVVVDKRTLKKQQKQAEKERNAQLVLEGEEISKKVKKTKAPKATGAAGAVPAAGADPAGLAISIKTAKPALRKGPKVKNLGGADDLPPTSPRTPVAA